MADNQTCDTPGCEVGKHIVNLGFKPLHYPDHLTYGLLSLHCSYSGADGTIRKGDKVIIPDTCRHVHKHFRENGADIDERMSRWMVADVISEASSGYLGIIYEHTEGHHLVLAHKSTDFCLSLTKNFLKGSGLQQDIEGIVMGNICLHQAHAYSGTKCVVELYKRACQTQNFTISFTGHSLGAWLAQLSVFYCHADFDLKLVQAVTFDGPGCREMLKVLEAGNVGERYNVPIDDIENCIVSYLIAPNVVNCVNTHIGTMYTILPNCDKTKGEQTKAMAHLSKLLQKLSPQANCALLSTLWHSLDFILTCFDINIGKPRDRKVVTKWPFITFDASSKEILSKNLTLPSRILQSISKFLTPEKRLVSTGLAIGTRIFCWQGTTAGSLLHLLILLLEGQINMEKFWLVHAHRSIYFGGRTNQSCVDNFHLRYSAQFNVTDDCDSHHAISRHMNALRRVLKNLQGKELIELVKMYEVHPTGYKPQAVGTRTIPEIKEILAGYFRDPDFSNFFKNVSMGRLPSNLNETSGQIGLKLENMELLTISRVVVVRGPAQIGKTYWAENFARVLISEVTPRLLNCSTKADFDSSIKECVQEIGLGNQVVGSIHLESLIDHLRQSQQQVLFILDDVKQHGDVIQMLRYTANMKNVKFVITTRSVNEFNCKRNAEIIIDKPMNTEMASGFIQRAQSLVNKSLIVQKIVTVINHIAPGHEITEKHLTNLLQELNPVQDIERGFVELRAQYLLTIKEDGTLKPHNIIKEMELSHPPVTAYLQCLSMFDPIQLNKHTIISKLSELNLESEVLSNLVMSVRNKCNLVRLLNEIIPNIICTQRNNLLQEFKECLLVAILKHGNTSIEHTLNRTHQRDPNARTNVDSNELQALIDISLQFGDIVKLDSNYNALVSADMLGSATHVLIVGSTGSGKSTIINHLIGNKLKCTQLATPRKPLQIRSLSDTGILSPPIGNQGTQSETDKVIPYVTNGSGGPSVVYWDCPGFFDTRGIFQRIRSALLLQQFRNIAVKVVIVMDAGTVATDAPSRGADLIAVLKLLSTLLPHTQDARDSLSIVLNKHQYDLSANTRLEQKEDYMHNFRDLMDVYRTAPFAWILDQFGSEQMLDRMAILPKVTKIGILGATASIEDSIMNDSFNDLERSIRNSSCSTICLNMAMDRDTSLSMVELSKSLTAQGAQVISAVIDLQKSQLRQMVADVDNFRKEHLQEYFNLPFDLISSDIFLMQFEKFSDDISSLERLRRIVQAKDFCRVCPSVESLKSTLTDWNTIISEYQAMRLELARPARTVHKTGADGNTLEIHSCILSAQEIQNEYNRSSGNFRLVKCTALLTIINQNLFIPGTDLCIISDEWRAPVKENVISLTGELNSGSFYGFGRVISLGEHLAIDVKGTDGNDGRVGKQYIEHNMRELKSSALHLQMKIQVAKIMQEHIGKGSVEDRIKKLEECVSVREDSTTGNETEVFRRLKDILEAHVQLEGSRELAPIQLKDFWDTTLHSQGTKNSLEQELDSIKQGLEELENQLKSEAGIEFFPDLEKLETRLRTRVYDILQTDAQKSRDKELKKLEAQYQQKQIFSLGGSTSEMSAEEVVDLEHSLKVAKKGRNELEKELGRQARILDAVEENARQLDEMTGRIVQVRKSKALFLETLKLRLASADHQMLQNKIQCIIKAKDRQRISCQMFCSSFRNSVVENSRFGILKKISRIPAKRELLNGEIDVCNPLEFDTKIKNLTKELGKLREKAQAEPALPLKVALHQFVKLEGIFRAQNTKSNLNKLIKKYDLNVNECALNHESGQLKLDKESARKQLKRCLNSRGPMDDKQLIGLATTVLLKLETRISDYQLLENYVMEMSNKLTVHKQEHGALEVIEKSFDNLKKQEWDDSCSHLLKAFDLYRIAEEKEWNLLKRQGRLSEGLLLNDFNLIHSEPESWANRKNKVLHIVKEALIFTSDFYETYELSHSPATAGGNSGGICLGGTLQNCIKCAQTPGKGGKHATHLEGVYKRVYAFPFLQGQTTNKIEANAATLASVGKLGLSFVDDVAFQVMAGTVVKTVFIPIGLIASAALASVAVVGSFVHQAQGSYWVSGPFKTDGGDAPDGDVGHADQGLLELCKRDYDAHKEEMVSKFPGLLSIVFNTANLN